MATKIKRKKKKKKRKKFKKIYVPSLGRSESFDDDTFVPEDPPSWHKDFKHDDLFLKYESIHQIGIQY